MTNLRTLNLSENNIFKIEGLENCVQLISLYIKKNKIGVKSNDDTRSGSEVCQESLAGLLECPSLESIELSDNYIEEPECIEEIFMKMPNLKVLYLLKCPVTREIKNYRKHVISCLPDLRYLDDRPVFDDDRRHAEAFARGGITEERKERDLIKEEKQAKHDKMHSDFRAMM